MAVNVKRQSELKELGFLLQNDKEHFAVRILSKAGNYTTEELGNIKYLADKYNGLYIDIDDYASNSIRAKVEAFLRLR